MENKGLCGADCEECGFGKERSCKGCVPSGGCPFGKQCFLAEYIRVGGKEALQLFLQKLISEINTLGIEGMPEVTELFPMNGAYVNLAYPLPGGQTAKFLDDDGSYLSCQLESAFGESERCFGVVANAEFLLVATYGCEGKDPELIAYRKR